MPALTLNYFGQGALLLADPDAVRTRFHDGSLVGVAALVIMATIWRR